MNKTFFFLIALMSLSNLSAELPKAILQARLHTISNNPHEVKVAKVHPGSTVRLTAEIKNVGSLPSAPGQIYVRFVLIEPMQDLLSSRLFQTESINIPSLLPGHVNVVEFTKEHKWPSLQDFIRQNWNMRHYQAVAKMEGENREIVIGHLPIFFSAYYYEGVGQGLPSEVKAKQDQ